MKKKTTTSNSKTRGPRSKVRMQNGLIGAGTNKSFRSKAVFKGGYIFFK